ncbi:LlaJI family restriction endonuclease [Pectobacterium parmentieri]|nr:LlaJI family restriction endonuclease [Pectobacterium parmentieri]
MMEPSKMTTVDILYLSDRMLLTDKCIPRAVIDELKRQGLIAPGMQKIHFCGVISYAGGLAIFLPRNNSGSGEQKDIAAHYLLRAFLKFYRNKETGVLAEDSGNQLIGGESLSLAVSLLDDYLANGLYVRRFKDKTTHTGKINWSRTILRSTAYPTHKGHLYIDLATTRSRYIANCETAKIQAYVIEELYSKFGLLWFGKSDIRDEQLLPVPKPSGSIEIQIAYLRRELQLSYSERDIFLIRSLIRYLEHEKGTDLGGFLIGVRKFHSLWETMLDECLVGKYPINNRLPIPVYQTSSDDFVPVANKGQRTDTVLRNIACTRIAVIDAKYYDAESPSSAPGWPDLVKQFYYHKIISYLEPAETQISNHFIFPGTKKKLKAVHVAKRDIIARTREDCLPDYSPIYCHYQDPLELLRLYVGGGKLIELTREVFELPNL